jgi:hypothetical protein
MLPYSSKPYYEEIKGDEERYARYLDEYWNVLNEDLSVISSPEDSYEQEESKINDKKSKLAALEKEYAEKISELKKDSPDYNDVILFYQKQLKPAYNEISHAYFDLVDQIEARLESIKENRKNLTELKKKLDYKLLWFSKHNSYGGSVRNSDHTGHNEPKVLEPVHNYNQFLANPYCNSDCGKLEKGTQCIHIVESLARLKMLADLEIVRYENCEKIEELLWAKSFAVDYKIRELRTSDHLYAQLHQYNVLGMHYM